MAIDFPNSPTVNQTFTSGSTTWVWDGTAWNLQTTTTASNDSMPVGSIMWFAITSTPTGWLPCDGTTYTNTAYPNLVAVIGTTFGGTPGTNFKVPTISATTGAYYIRYTTAVGVTSTLSLLSAPVGSMVQWPVTSSYPTGWLRCDGSNISRTSYADLFALIGTTYGTGDGSTTFTLPNIAAAGTGSPVYIIKATTSGLIEPSTVAHAASHIRGGTDIIDGDRVQIDYVPVRYTRDSSDANAGVNTDITAHLKGIDNMFASRMVKIGNFTVGANTLDYTSIPQTYTHLRVIGYMQTTRAGFTNTGFRLRWNGYSANYNGTYNATSTLGASSSLYIGQGPAGSKGNNNYVLRFDITFPHYSGALIKTMHGQSSGHDGTNVLGQVFTGVYDGGVAGISSITIFDDVGSALGPNCGAELYGIL